MAAPVLYLSYARQATGKVLHADGGAHADRLQPCVVETRRVMSSALIFSASWNKWYRGLHYRKAFGLFDSLRLGLWLACG